MDIGALESLMSGHESSTNCTGMGNLGSICCHCTSPYEGRLPPLWPFPRENLVLHTSQPQPVCPTAPSMIRKLGRSTRPEIAHVKETDLKATKRHASAFGNPEFGAMLKREGCDALLIVGPSASGCVLGTC